MVRPSTLLVNPPSADPLLEDLVRHRQLNHLGNGSALFGEHLVECFGLNEGSGESIEDESQLQEGDECVRVSCGKLSVVKVVCAFSASN